jgi:3-phenylpropionate/cinnamic acid dioxygenase small subunit
MESTTAITNLLYRYAELMDAGELEQVADLFADARVTLGGGQVVSGAASMLEQWRAFVRIHPCGTPRTRHVITNPIIEIDETAGTAICRSVYTVFQQTPELPLQAIASGRYHDSFERVDGAWRYATRDYSMLDYIGDLSQHMLLPVG